MGYYPIVLRLEGRPCVVIGGGPVAERKVEGLLATGAQVTLVTPESTVALRTLAAEGRIRHVARRWRPGDLDGAALVFVATDDGALTAEVAREARARRVWVNAADDPAHCDFILPSVLRRGHLVVAVATGGVSPALSRVVREELESHLGEEYAALLDVVGEVRRELRAHGRAPEAGVWRRALDPELRRLVAAGRRGDARARLLERLGAER